MKPIVDQEKCIGCGTCVALCPECFELNAKGKSQVKCSAGCPSCNLEEVKDACPVEAISLEQ